MTIERQKLGNVACRNAHLHLILSVSALRSELIHV